MFNGQQVEFEQPIYWAVVWSAALLLLGVAAFFKHMRIADRREITAAGVWLLPLTYILSSFVAVSHYLAVNMILVMCMNAAFFTIGVFLLQHRAASRVMRAALLWTTYLIVIYGFINWFGQRLFAGGLVGWFSHVVANGVYTDAVMTDSNGLRLTSVFQYANTYAAFLMAMLFAVLFTASRSLKLHDRLIHGFMLVPIILSIALTLSRGGLVMLPVVFIVLLLFLKPAQQLTWIINLVISAAISLIVLQPITDLGLSLNQVYNGGDAFKGWALLIGASAIGAVLVWLVGRYLQPLFERKFGKWSSRRGASLWLPLGGIVVVAVLALLLIGTGLRNALPENVRIRVENINFQQHSVLERITFYKDSMKMVADYPVLGGGGGAWAVLYEKYQNNPYVSNQTHNFFLQYLDETGIVGILVLLSFLVYVFYQYLRSYYREQDEEKKQGHFFYFLIAFSILAHSLLDFNMSYVYVSILVFFSLGGMAAAIRAVPLLRHKEIADTKPAEKKSSGSGLPVLYSVAAAAAAVVLLVVSGRYVAAASDTQEASRLLQGSEQKSYEQVREPLDNALNVRPTYPTSVVQLAAVLQSVYNSTQDANYLNEAETLLKKALEREPYSKDIINQLSAIYMSKNDTQSSFDLLADNLEKFNWDMSWYEQVIGQSVTIGYLALNTGDLEAQKAAAQRGIDAYRHMLANVEHLKTLPEGQMQGREFTVTPAITLNAGKAMYLSGQTEEAAATLKGLLTEEYANPETAEAARWYLIALKKMGQEDPAVYEALIKADPASKEQIEMTAAMKF
ncbi:O-antigen ligase family protein [Saccharibacillus deserti]|uniref:O-antigen ligase family protein n=1 Tax=Saccharibacillus deserti TaxID=1634444 RepID=UPI001FE4209A|nr:O-antigen ligase family protein [Saccharibacillus deserti]